jgi:hypothetical protein
MAGFGDVLKKNRGYSAFEKREEEVEERSKGRVGRFWLPPEKGAKIIFLDDDPPILEEHQLKVNGDWKNWYTCRRILGEPCVICDELKDTPSTVGYYTILDLSEYKNRKGETVRNTIKLFAPKFKALQVVKRASAKRGGLAMWVCDVYRTTSESFNVGDVLDFEEKTDWESIKELNPDAAVLDYAELLAPKSNAELKKLLRLSTENSVDAGVGDYESTEDEVDF